MKTYNEFLNEKKINESKLYSEILEDWLEDYINWNTQNGKDKPAYAKASESSVMEFFQNNHEDDCNDWNINNLLNELKRKENPQTIWDKYGKNLPKIFKSTFYRLPKKEDLIDINSFNLKAEDILDGFCYTIIGRSIFNDKHKKDIITSIEMLCNLFPKNKEYLKALELAKKEKVHV